MKKLAALALSVIFTLCLLSAGMSEEINVTPSPQEDDSDVTNDTSEIAFTFLSLDDLLAAMETEGPADDARPDAKTPEQPIEAEEAPVADAPEAPVDPTVEEPTVPEAEPVEADVLTPDEDQTRPEAEKTTFSAEEPRESPMDAETSPADETEASPLTVEIPEAPVQDARPAEETIEKAIEEAIIEEAIIEEAIIEEAFTEEAIIEEAIFEEEIAEESIVDETAPAEIIAEEKPEEPIAEEIEAENSALPEEEAAKPVEIRNGIVLSGDHEGKVVVYQLPDANSPILTYLTKGDTIQVAEIDAASRMARVCLDGDSLYGYIFSDHIALFNATPEEQAVVRSISISDNIDHTQPLREGSVIRLSVSLTGFEGMNYSIQWQYSPDDGVTAYDIPGANNATYAYRVNEENLHNIYRVIVTYDD